MRNKIVLLIVFLLFATTAFAAAPKLLNFQGRLINKDTGAPITGGVQITFELFKAGDVTTNWDETVNISCDNEGVFSVVLGNGIKPLDTVNFDQPLWMEIEYNGQVFAPKQRLTMTPYSFYAVTAESVVSGGMGAVPVGTILPFGGSTKPAGYLLCDGTEYQKSDYLALEAVIGTAYGGNPGTTFNVPDMGGRTPVGVTTEVWGDTLGEVTGEAYHTLTVSEMPSHRHSYVYRAYTEAGIGNGGIADDTTQGGYTSYVGGGRSHITMQPSLIVNYIIKY